MPARTPARRRTIPTCSGCIYAVPYQVLEPDLAFVVEGPDGVCGYLFGAPDTQRIQRAPGRANGIPVCSQRVADPGPDPSTWRGSDWARHLIHHPEPAAAEIVARYPSHGHIDLLPQARGRGIGSQAMMFLMQRLAAAGSKGMFLDVDPRNLGAREFYRKLGFSPFRSNRCFRPGSLYGQDAFIR